MSCPSRLARVAPFLTFTLGWIIAGCSSGSAPLGPGKNGAVSLSDGLRSEALVAAQGGPPASLRNIWPNEDGRAWTYRIDQRTWDFAGFHLYATEAEVPPIPTLDQVEALLGNHPIGANPTTASAGYRMQFNGLKTTLSGAVGQNLETEVFDLGTRSVPSELRGARFLRALAKARPDLAAKIHARSPAAFAASTSTALISTDVDEPLFLFGYAWEKTRDYIGSYGDLNRNLSWKYLEANLDPGHEFSMQLVPDLADDVFLHVRILRELTASTAVGSFAKSIEVLYLVDFGVSEGTDENGNTIGYWHAYSYGTITYAPRVGPVSSYERDLVSTGEPLDPGFGELTVTVTSVEPGSHGQPPLP